MRSVTLRRFVSAAGLPLLLASALSAQTTRASVQVDTTTPAGLGLENSDIGSQGDLSVVIYSEATAPIHVYATTSDAAGVTWSTPVQIDADASGAVKIAGYRNKTHNVAVVGDAIYTIWIDDRNGALDSDIYFARSTDRGVSWSEQRIDKGQPGGSFFDVEEYTFAVSGDVAGDHIYIGMRVDNAGIDEFFLASSHDGGATFISTIAVSTLSGTADVDGLSICAEGLNVHTAFTDVRAGNSSFDDLWYRGSSDGGISFGPEIQLDASGPLVGDLSVSPAIDCLGDRIAVVFEEELTNASNEEVRAIVSIDGGFSFLSDQLVSTFDPNLFDADGVNVAICGTNVIALWDDSRLGGDAAFLSVSDDDGLSWGTEVQISTSGSKGFPKADSNRTDIVVVSSEGSDSPNVFETSWSNDCGLTWTPFFTASDTGGDVDHTRVIYNASLMNVLLMWVSDQAGANNAFVGGYSLCDGGSITTRNAGSNPSSYTASIPVLGEPFTATVDLSTTGHSLAVIVGFGSPLSIDVGGGQFLLVNILDAGGEILGTPAAAGPLASFSISVPTNPALCGLSIATQAVHIGGAPFALSNAQDVVISGL